MYQIVSDIDKFIINSTNTRREQVFFPQELMTLVSQYYNFSFFV